MSPEQVRGEPLDARSDLFSFGLVLYEMATAHQAFEGATVAVVSDGVLNKSPVPVRELNPEVPLDLERIISKALEKAREARFQSAAEIAAASVETHAKPEVATAHLQLLGRSSTGWSNFTGRDIPGIQRQERGARQADWK